MTDPDPGGSISLREFLSTNIEALEKHLTHEIAALRRETTQANTNAQQAIEVAADEAKERLKAHNGLLEKMETQAEQFATRESVSTFRDAFEDRKNVTDERFGRLEKFQYMLTGAIFLVSLVGLANLVKVWSG